MSVAARRCFAVVRQPDRRCSRIVRVMRVVGISIAVMAASSVWCQANVPDPDPVVWKLATIRHHPWFTEVLVASLIGWVIGYVKGFSSAAEWLAKYWPKPNKLVVFLLDLLVFGLVGGYLGTAIFNPTSLNAALAAGISWPLAFGGLTSKG